MPVWGPAAIIFLGAAVLAGLLILNRDNPDWQATAPAIVRRVLFLVGIGLIVGLVLILNSR